MLHHLLHNVGPPCCASSPAPNARRYLARLSHEGTSQLAPIAGAALLANAGPREFMPRLQWFQSQRSLWHCARVFLWMLKRPVHDCQLVREMFFSDDLPEEHFQR